MCIKGINLCSVIVYLIDIDKIIEWILLVWLCYNEVENFFKLINSC